MSAFPAANAVIIGTGARSASGLTALQVTMSARAQKFAPRESHLVDRAGQPIATARLASIGDNVFGLERFAALGAPALVQAAYPWFAAQRRRLPSAVSVSVPLILALPSQQRPGFDRRLKTQLLDTLERSARVPIDHAQSRLVFGCRGGGAEAVQLALESLHRGDTDAVLVGGIDSWFDPDALEHLDHELRLHGPDTENGFIPGEGAGFLLLAARPRAAQFEHLGQVVAAVVEHEPHPWGSDEPCLGEGITKAVRRAAAAAGATPSIPWALTDVTNERHRVDEWMYALGRNHMAFTADVVHDQPLLKTGDLGAASTAVLLVIAVTRWAAGCAPGGAALVVTSSDGPKRGAVLAAATPG